VTNNTVRIIAGKYKGRKIKFPSINGLRPTSDRIKEIIFNWLQPYIHGAICIDAFAGSGSLGIEAISRGANKSIFYEININAISHIKNNLISLNINNFQISQTDSIKALEMLATENHDYIILLDPPFDKGIANIAIDVISNNDSILKGTIVYVETEKNCSLNLEKFEILKEKKTGNILVRLIVKA